MKGRVICENRLKYKVEFPLKSLSMTEYTRIQTTQLMLRLLVHISTIIQMIKDLYDTFLPKNFNRNWNKTLKTVKHLRSTGSKPFMGI